MIDSDAIKTRFDALAPVLDERGRRRFAAAEALAAGWGGIRAVSEVTGIARSTIGRGLGELRDQDLTPIDGVRRKGAGRPLATVKDPSLMSDLERLVEPGARGDPMSPLRWTTKSLSKLTGALRDMGHKIGRDTVSDLLHKLGFSLQANRKTVEGSDHADRDAQFKHISEKVGKAVADGQPAISVDTKKKELVGNFKNAGREYRPAGDPEPVRVHDFIDPALGRASPYGVYDIANDKGWVSVGIDHDTSSFAVNTVRSWWNNEGIGRFPQSTRLTITADGGGSNGSRVRLWKVELQKFADETGLEIDVCHFPPGTSKWNKIEHRLFSFITRNWRGRPLADYLTIVELIGATTSSTGLTVRCELDENLYPAGIKVSDQEMAALNIVRDEFHGEWNYTILPKTTISKR